MRRFLAALLLSLFLMLPFQPALAQIPVTDVAHIAINYAGWIAQATSWVSQLAKMVEQYQQLVKTYTLAQHVAEQLKHPSLYTVISLFAVVPSRNLTNINTIQDFRSILEGVRDTAALGQLYSQLYGNPLDLAKLAPTGPKNWDESAKLMAEHTQSADSAIIETMAVASNTLKSLQELHAARTYEQISATLKSPDITPHQTAQLGALSALYTAQAVDKLTQVTTAQATMAAQKEAQVEYWRKIGDNNAAMNQKYQKEAEGKSKDFMTTWQQWQRH